MARLSADAVEGRLQKLPGWTRDGDVIRRQFVFDGFASGGLTEKDFEAADKADRVFAGRRAG